MGADEPSNTSTLSKQLSLSMAISPQCQQFRPHPPYIGYNSHRWTHHHRILSIPGQQNMHFKLHGEFHNICHNTQ
jgi:hypothetical protein